MSSDHLSSNNLKGLILIGGKSSRMKTDKSELNYFGVTQKDYLRELLINKGIATYFSVSGKSKSTIEIQDFKPNLGPIGGICSAFEKDSNSAWLVLAIDAPFVNSELIDFLLERRNPSKMATTVRGKNKSYPEPLIAIYEPKAYHILLDYIAKGILSPKKIMTESDIEILEVEDSMIRNVNTPEEFEAAKQELT